MVTLTLADARPLGLLVPLLVLVVWLSRGSRAAVSRAVWAVSLVLRILLVLCLGCAVSGLAVERTTERLCLGVALDVSDSMDEVSVKRGISWVDELWRRKAPGDELRVVVFGERAVEVAQVEVREDRIVSLRERVGRGASDLARGVDLARALVAGTACVGKVVLVSDGRATRGNLEQARRPPGFGSRAQAGGPRVYFARIAPEVRPDVAIGGITLPPEVHAGEPFRFQVMVSSVAAARARLEVRFGKGEPAPLAREVELLVGDTIVSLEATLTHEGDLNVESWVEPLGEDAFRENNRAEAVLSVRGLPKVLVLDPEPGNVSSLLGALRAQKFAVEALRPSELPVQAALLRDNALILLSDLARSDLTPGAEARLIDYVRNGGALLFSGGERSYGAGGFEGSPLERILPLAVAGEEEQGRASVAMALVIDRSGSMQGEPLEMAKAACLGTLSLLEPSDLLEVVAFDAKPVRVVPMQGARRGERIGIDLSRLESGGGTEIFPALDMAYQDLLGAQAKKKHIVLLTDGNADSEGLAELAAAALADGITLTTVGFGASIHEVLLRSLADLGGGRFHVAREARALPRIFARETELTTLEETTHEFLTIQVQGSRPWLKGVPFASAPPLLGAAKLRLRPPPAQLILGLDNGYPLLGEMRVGSGVTLAWASDLKSNYARHFLGWSHLPRFLAQMIRAHAGSRDDNRWPLSAEVDGDELVVSFEAVDPELGFNNDLRSRLWVKGTAPDSAEVEHPFSWVLPGRYAARLSAPERGVYRLRAEHQDGKGNEFRSRELSIVRGYPEEYRKVATDSVDRTGGRSMRQSRASRMDERPPAGSVQSETDPGARTLGWTPISEPDEVLVRDAPHREQVFLGSWCLGGSALLLVLEVAVRRWARVSKFA